MHQGRNAGFTLIELVVGMVLLGILAATALPRFMNVDEEAHASVVDGVMGSLQTGSAMYHAQWMAEGQPNTNTQSAEFNNLRVNAVGYPYGTTDRSSGTSTVTDSSDCVAIFQGILQAGAPSITAAANAAAVVGNNTDFAAVVSAPNCTFYYTGKDNASGSTVSTLTYTSTTGALTSGTATLP